MTKQMLQQVVRPGASSVCFAGNRTPSRPIGIGTTDVGVTSCSTDSHLPSSQRFQGGKGWREQILADPFVRAVMAELGNEWGTGDLARDEAIFQRAKRIAQHRLAIEQLREAA
jgi:hypothetical protein